MLGGKADTCLGSWFVGTMVSLTILPYGGARSAESWAKGRGNVRRCLVASSIIRSRTFFLHRYNVPVRVRRAR